MSHSRGLVAELLNYPEHRELVAVKVSLSVVLSSGLGPLIGFAKSLALSPDGLYLYLMSTN